MRFPACCRQKNATFSPHIHGTWEAYFSPSLYEILLFRLQELLDEQGIKLFPGDDRQLLMVLRAANSDPELAVEVAKKYISFSRYVLDSKA